LVGSFSAVLVNLSIVTFATTDPLAHFSRGHTG
jgi:hypothetical protein